MVEQNAEHEKTKSCEFALTDADLNRISSHSVADQTDLFSTVSNETRYRILLYLIAAEEPVCGCELEPHLDVGQSTVSQSLNRLYKSGLVTRTKDGRWRYYEPTPLAERLTELVDVNFSEKLVTAD